MSRHNSVEIEFVAPEAEITLEGNCVHDNTGTFRVLTLPDEGMADNLDTYAGAERVAGHA